MPWARTDSMSERLKFIATYLEYEVCFSELCHDFGISRKTGYKWLRRYEVGGASALNERSRAPREHPNAVDEEVVEAIVALRRKHPRWGPRKLKVVLARNWAKAELPATSTIGDILKRHGLVHPRRRIRRSSPFPDQLRQYAAPNAVWCADFKGHFPIGGERCHPLTISDGFSRYLLSCRALRRPLHRYVKDVFEAAFREYGLPKAIRTDNGPPFSTLALAGLSRLAVWWIRLGILPERIMPGRPDQNGRHERMHSTLKADTAKPPRSSFSGQQRAFDRFRLEYNQERPHEALDQQVPAALYRPSLRSYPTYLPQPEYPSRFETRLVYPNGVFSFFSMTQWYTSICLAGERVGLEPCDDGCWRVHYGFVPLGVLDLKRAMERRNRQFGQLIPIVAPSHRRRRPPYGR